MRGKKLVLLGIARANASSFTFESAEVVELGAADFALDGDFDFGKARAVDGEDALNADTVGDFAGGEGFAKASAAASDDDAFEHLNALFVAFLNFDVHADGVAGAEVGEVRAELAAFDFLDEGGAVHL